MEKIYSTDEETFNYDYECCIDAVFYENPKPGDIMTIYEGEPAKLKISKFLRVGNIVDDISELAYEEYGEIAEDYLSQLNEPAFKDLDEAMKNTIDAWADKYNLHPKFYGIKNIKKIKLKILDTEGGVETVET